MAALLDRRDETWLRGHVDRWVGEGVITPEQAEAVLRLEAATPAAPRPGLPLAAEVTAYLGSLLAVVGGMFVVGRAWRDVATPLRLAVGLAVLAAGFVAGRVVRRIGGEGAERLGGFLWLVGAGGAALATGVLADAAGTDDAALFALYIGAVTAALGAALWRNLERPFQFLTTVVGLTAAGSGLAAVLDAPDWTVAVVVWPFGIAVLAAALLDGLHPSPLVAMAGGIASMASVISLVEIAEEPAFLFGLATAALVTVAGLATHTVPVVAAGVVGFLQFLQATLATMFSGPLASVLVLLLGLALVVSVIVRVMRSTRSAPPST